LRDYLLDAKSEEVKTSIPWATTEAAAKAAAEARMTAPFEGLLLRGIFRPLQSLLRVPLFQSFLAKNQALLARIDKEAS